MHRLPFIFISSLIFAPLLLAQPLTQPPNLPMNTQLITTTNPELAPNTIEASGILWLPHANHYLLISDEAYNDEPGLFALNSDGQLTAQIALPKKVNIDDLESISTDGKFIYVLSSLAHNKRDELKTKRKQLLRFEYKHGEAKHAKTLNLYDVLAELREDQPTSPVAQFLAPGFEDHRLDIESHFVKDNDLYIGFKDSLGVADNTIILKLSNLDKLFDGKAPVAEIWQSLLLADPATQKPTQLSDLLLLDDSLYLLSGANTVEKNSFLWRYSLTDKKLQLLTTFTGLKAEGISYRADLSQLMVVFDEGKGNPSKYTVLPLPTH